MEPEPRPLGVKMWYVPIQHSPSQLLNEPPIDAIPKSKALGDTREYFESVIHYDLNGHAFHFAPREEAFFNRRLRVLVVWAKPETIALIDWFAGQQWQLGSVGEFGGTLLIRAEVSLVEFSASEKPESGGKTSVKSLRRAAGDSWRVLNRMQLVTPHGRSGLAISKTGTNEKHPVIPPPEEGQDESMDKSLALLPGEFGATLRVEPAFESLSPNDQRNIQVSLSYQYRAPGPSALDWKTTTLARITDGQPTLLQVEPAAPNRKDSHPKRFRGLILRVDVLRLGEIAPHPETHAGVPTASPPPK